MVIEQSICHMSHSLLSSVSAAASTGHTKHSINTHLLTLDMTAKVNIWTKHRPGIQSVNHQIILYKTNIIIIIIIVYFLYNTPSK